MKTAYRDDLHLSKSNVKRLEEVNAIIKKYAAEGYRLTLRQLYYQLVTMGLIANEKSEYAKLGNILVKGRMAGIVDWEAIEDRIRVPNLPYWVSDIPDALDDTIRAYRLNRQEGQDNYIEVWCEKDALSNVLKRVTYKYHINLIVNRGYSSCTAMHDASNRFQQAMQNGQDIKLLYLGDHDPSGLDMIRDILDRETEFNIRLEVKHLALTTKQVQKYDPPPNPAKIKDPRAGQYISEHGDTSWEVDALEPKVLHAILNKAIEKYMDMDGYNEQLEQEKRDKAKLQDYIDNFDEDAE
jgi:hypothetical protein